MKKTWSWGNYPLAEHEVESVSWRAQDIAAFGQEKTLLPYGYGRSYGDVPLNDGGYILKTSGLNRILEFDIATGVFHCEAGMSFQEILRIVVPRGWFLPVSPGTQFVTIGGAVANDVHGKNHHGAGTLGRHVLGFELLRSDGSRRWCSPEQQAPLFAATIGGLGLTGLVVTVKIQLLKVSSSDMVVANRAFGGLEEGLELFEQYSGATYSVAWVDCLASGKALGRGIFSSAEHSQSNKVKKAKPSKLMVPFNFPSFALNRWSVKAFNELYFQKGRLGSGEQLIHYDPFFYPLDGIRNWNRIYGKKGFFQHQCVVPFGSHGEGKAAIREMLNKIALSGNASFLAVLKVFGNSVSPGLLSFPTEGITLALDFSNKGLATLKLMEQLDEIVRKANGRIYPAKDARMSAEDFQSQYPRWREFAKQMDPQFSSSFWRRVTKTFV